MLGPTGADKQSRAARSRSTRVLVLGSFPPRECGIATFTKHVVDSLAACADVQCDVIAIDEPGSEARTYGRRVVARLTRDDVASYTSLAGGEDGASFPKLIAAVRKPVVVVLHTILTAPDAHHRAVTQRICAGASAIVVLSHTGKDILKRLYSVNENSICPLMMFFMMRIMSKSDQDHSGSKKP